MFGKLRKLAANNEGFSLTEVMIGMMILTVAIVSATNLLVGLINTNKNIVGTLQAYYFAQEGIESVRNIRDTNWLNNVDWRGRADILGSFENNSDYVVGLRSSGWKNSAQVETFDLNIYKTWEWKPGVDEELCLQSSGDSHFYSSCSLSASGEKTGFRRTVQILPYCEDIDRSICDDSVLIRSVVEWEESGKDRELILEDLITDWKGGAL